MIGPADATRALQLVAQKLGVPTISGEPLGPSLRAGELRKVLWKRFDPVPAQQAMAALWRSAPRDPGSPEPNEDQSKAVPGLRQDNRNTPVGFRNYTIRIWLRVNG